MARKLTDKNPLRALRNKNQHSLLEVLRSKGPVSIPETARIPGFSGMTVHKLMDQLLEAGMALDAGKGEAAGDVGKRPALFAFNAGCKFVFTVKITDHELLAGITDLSGNIPLKQLIGDALPKNVPVIVDNCLRFHAHAEMKTREERAIRNFCILGTPGRPAPRL